MSGQALVVQGDALRLPLPDASVDLICTSPPYLWKRKYAIDGAGEMGNEANWRLFLDNLWAATDEMLRVLRPTGSIFVNLGDTRVTGREPKWLGIPVKSRLLIPERYRVGCQDRYAAQGVAVRQVQIWEKVNGLPESTTDRTRDSHEDWVHLVKRPSYYSAVDEIRLPGSGYSRANGIARATPAGQRTRNMTDAVNPLGALPGSVWAVPSEPLRLPPWLGIQHYAAFPSEVVRRIALAFSPPGICLDCGHGRVPVVEREKHDSTLRMVGVGAGRGSLQENTYGFNAPGDTRASVSATILGYACSCTPFTDHPGSGEPRDIGGEVKWSPDGQNPRQRQVGGHLANAPKVGPWREYHLDRWRPPPTRPAVVVDPFMGTGTVLGVARQLGRIGVGTDLSFPYCRAARYRVFQSGDFGKAEARTWADRQGSLL